MTSVIILFLGAALITKEAKDLPVQKKLFKRSFFRLVNHPDEATVCKMYQQKQSFVLAKVVRMLTYTVYWLDIYIPWEVLVDIPHLCTPPQVPTSRLPPLLSRKGETSS